MSDIEPTEAPRKRDEEGGLGGLVDALLDLLPGGDDDDGAIDSPREVDEPIEAADPASEAAAGSASDIAGAGSGDRDQFSNVRFSERSPEGAASDGGDKPLATAVETTFADSPGARSLDSDADGVVDEIELANLTDPTNPDTDSDEINDGDELLLGTDPTKADSDGDGIRDSDEVFKIRTDPTKADTDGDGVDDDEELRAGTDPLQAPPPPAPPAAVAPAPGEPGVVRAPGGEQLGASPVPADVTERTVQGRSDSSGASAGVTGAPSGSGDRGLQDMVNPDVIPPPGQMPPSAPPDYAPPPPPPPPPPSAPPDYAPPPPPPPGSYTPPPPPPPPPPSAPPDYAPPPPPPGNYTPPPPPGGEYPPGDYTPPPPGGEYPPGYTPPGDYTPPPPPGGEYPPGDYTPPPPPGWDEYTAPSMPGMDQPAPMPSSIEGLEMVAGVVEEPTIPELPDPIAPLVEPLISSLPEEPFPLDLGAGGDEMGDSGAVDDSMPDEPLE